MEKSKEPIRIRKRALRNGNISLYLDIYMNGGKATCDSPPAASVIDP